MSFLVADVLCFSDAIAFFAVGDRLSRIVTALKNVGKMVCKSKEVFGGLEIFLMRGNRSDNP